jgi:hypothetical protein
MCLSTGATCGIAEKASRKAMSTHPYGCECFQWVFAVERPLPGEFQREDRGDCLRAEVHSLHWLLMISYPYVPWDAHRPRGDDRRCPGEAVPRPSCANLLPQRLRLLRQRPDSVCFWRLERRSDRVGIGVVLRRPGVLRRYMSADSMASAGSPSRCSSRARNCSSVNRCRPSVAVS